MSSSDLFTLPTCDIRSTHPSWNDNALISLIENYDGSINCEQINVCCEEKDENHKEPECTIALCLL